jgi:hypothetical protein
MRKRRTMLAAVSLLCLSLVGWQPAGDARSQPGVTRENYERIRIGMPIEEAVAILGKDTGCVGSINGGYSVFWVRKATAATPDATISLGYEVRGCQAWRVTSKHAEWNESTFWDRLRRLLPW